MQRLQEYVKYTKTELDSYSKTEGSCVYKINQNLHFAIYPYILQDLNSKLPAFILKNKVGYYDAELNGIILAVKNIKVLNGAAALRFDDAKLHVDINADCYVFRPEEGAILTGIPKHIGKHHVGIIIYRVFNASIRLEELVNKAEVKLNQELQFQVNNFNIRIAHPYIQGALLNVKREGKIEEKPKGKKITFKSEDEDSNDESELVANIKQEKKLPKADKRKNKKITFASDDEELNDNCKDVNGHTPDSGIEEKDEKDMELSELLSLIKNEPLSESEEEIKQDNRSEKKLKRRRSSVEPCKEAITAVKLKSEPDSIQRKRQSTKQSDTSDSEEKIELTKKKIKREKVD